MRCASASNKDLHELARSGDRCTSGSLAWQKPEDPERPDLAGRLTCRHLTQVSRSPEWTVGRPLIGPACGQRPLLALVWAPGSGRVSKTLCGFRSLFRSDSGHGLRWRSGLRSGLNLCGLLARDSPRSTDNPGIRLQRKGCLRPGWLEIKYPEAKTSGCTFWPCRNTSEFLRIPRALGITKGHLHQATAKFSYCFSSPPRFPHKQHRLDQYEHHGLSGEWPHQRPHQRPH